MPDRQQVQIREFVPVSAELDRMFDVTILRHNGELKLSVSRHGIFAGMVPNTLSTNRDFGFGL